MFAANYGDVVGGFAAASNGKCRQEYSAPNGGEAGDIQPRSCRIVGKHSKEVVIALQTELVDGLAAELVEPGALQSEVVGSYGAATAKTSQGLDIGVLGHIMAIGEARKSLVLFA